MTVSQVDAIKDWFDTGFRRLKQEVDSGNAAITKDGICRVEEEVIHLLLRLRAMATEEEE